MPEEPDREKLRLLIEEEIENPFISKEVEVMEE